MLKRMSPGLAVVFLAGAISLADEAVKAMVVSVEKVDTATKTISGKTADGTEAAFKYTDKTTVAGAKDVGKASDLAGKDGYHFVVHYTKVGGDNVATGMDYAGKGSWKAVKGTVVAVDHGGKTITVKAADGTVATYHLAEHCTVDTGKAIGKVGAESGKGIAKGSEVTVHFTEEGGKKVAHFFKSLG